jgi:hypothetical protein
MSEITAELANEMATEWKRMAGVDKSDIGPHFAANWIETAKELVAKISDHDLQEARGVAADVMNQRDDGLGGTWVAAMVAGEMDHGNMVAIALAGIKRGRELATPATSA